jgi:hypothetical protein
MTTDSKTHTETLILGAKKSIDRSIRTLVTEMEHENTLVPETPIARLQKVVKIFRGIKPLLSVIGTLPILPLTWRSAINMFHQALEALSVSTPEVSADFKAGKDLEPEA